MESMTAELYALSECASRLRRVPERIQVVLGNLSMLASQTASTAESAKAVPLQHEAARIKRADAELAAARLELAVKQARAEWRGFVSDVEELLASLEAAPLLSVCPD